MVIFSTLGEKRKIGILLENTGKAGYSRENSGKG
jgi:hypothetical protein